MPSNRRGSDTDQFISDKITIRKRHHKSRATRNVEGNVKGNFKGNFEGNFKR